MPRPRTSATAREQPRPPEVIPNGVYTFDEAAAVLRVCKRVLREEIREGRLIPATPASGRYYRFLGTALIAWLELSRP